jgi:hypothetical protein
LRFLTNGYSIGQCHEVARLQKKPRKNGAGWGCGRTEATDGHVYTIDRDSPVFLYEDAHANGIEEHTE